MTAYCDDVEENVAVAVAPRSTYNRGTDRESVDIEDDPVARVPPRAWWPAALAWLWCCTTLFAIYSFIFIALINRTRGDD